MLVLAWKNLIHDRVRLVVTLVGIVFALVLILIQFGLFLGFIDTSSNVVAESRADLWVTVPAIPHVNGGNPMTGAGGSGGGAGGPVRLVLHDVEVAVGGD